VLRFAIDLASGHVHTQLDNSGLVNPELVTEKDVEDFTRYFHSVIGNRTVELSVDDAVPVDCDVVIPVNIIPQIPEEAVARALEAFRRSRAQPA
jgi:glutamate dehydrogenase/leucine dehydrogenase